MVQRPPTASASAGQGDNEALALHIHFPFYNPDHVACQEEYVAFTGSPAGRAVPDIGRSKQLQTTGAPARGGNADEDLGDTKSVVLAQPQGQVVPVVRNAQGLACLGGRESPFFTGIGAFFR